MSEYIEFSGNRYSVVEEFKVYHEGWEMDNVAWSCTDPNGNAVCIMTSHGRYFIASTEELQNLHDKHLSASEAMNRVITKIKENDK